jgi:hypothetical protein
VDGVSYVVTEPGKIPKAKGKDRKGKERRGKGREGEGRAACLPNLFLILLITNS